MEILKKWHRSTVFLREWPFFWRKLDLRAACFLENGRFLHESDNFSVRNRKKKGIILTFLAQNILVLTKLTLSLTKYGNEGFSMLFEKITWDYSIFMRMNVLLIKWGVEELCVLENGSFLTIYGQGMGALIFSWNSLF